MEFATGISAAKAALEALQLAQKARDQAKIDAATLDLKERLMAMSDLALDFMERGNALVTENARLVMANAELLQAKTQLEERIRERQSYVLHQARPGAFVYANQPGVHGDHSPAHYLCQPCYDHGTKSVLRYTGPDEWTHGKWTCPADPRHSFSENTKPGP